MAAYLERSNANAGGAFASSRETDALLAEAHQAAAELVGAEADEIAFGANMTTLNFLLTHAVARTLEPGDEVVVTQLDHDANVSPWFRAAEDRGLRHPGRADRPRRRLAGPRRARGADRRANPGGRLHPGLERPRQYSATRGRIAAAAHGVGALAWADGVHLAPHRRLDRDALGADVLLCSPYKFFGPHVGLAAIRRDLAETLPADRVRAADSEPPGHRFETGTLSHEALAGTVAAIDYLAGLGGSRTATAQRGWTPRFAAIRAHEEALTLRFLAALEGIDGVRLHGIARPGAGGRAHPDLPARGRRHAPAAAAAALGERGMFAWDGHFYAVGPMKALGLLPDGGAAGGLPALHDSGRGRRPGRGARRDRARERRVERRARRWRLDGLEAVCDVVEPWAHGTVMRATRYPDATTTTTSSASRATRAGRRELIAAADDQLASLEHRRLDFDPVEAGERVRADLEAAHWEATRLLWMRHEAPLPAGPAVDGRGGRLRRRARPAAAPGTTRTSPSSTAAAISPTRARSR